MTSTSFSGSASPPRGASSAAGLTPRERLLRALRNEPADRVPVWMMRQAGRYLPQYHAVRSKYDFLTLCKTPDAAAEVSIQPVEAIDTDAVIIFNDILVPLEHCGAAVDFDDRGPLIRNAVRSAQDLRELKRRPVADDEPIAGTIAEVRRRVGPDFPVLGFVGAPWTLAAYWIEGRMTRQFEHVGSLRFSDPGFLDSLLERLTEVAAEYLAVQIRAGADAVQIFDTWGSILSAQEYETFSGQWIARIVSHVRPLGVPVIVYVNGCAPYLEQLARLGADCLSIDWRLPLAEARLRLEESIALQGNLDPLCLLAGPEATARTVESCFQAFPAGPGHVFNLGHGILPNTSVESARALIKAVKQHGRY